MTLARYAKKRDANEAEIVAALRDAGVKVFPLDQPVDLLCWSPDHMGSGRWWLCEVKTAEGRLTPAQRAFLAEFEDTKAVAFYVVRTAQEALAAAAEVGEWR